jgi:hypothetical protein
MKIIMEIEIRDDLDDEVIDATEARINAAIMSIARPGVSVTVDDCLSVQLKKVQFKVTFDTHDGFVGLTYGVEARTVNEAIERTKEQYPESTNHAVERVE